MHLVGERRDLAQQRIGMLHCLWDATESRRGEVARREWLRALLERAPDDGTAGIGVPMARRATGCCTTLSARYMDSRRLDRQEAKL